MGEGTSEQRRTLGFGSLLALGVNGIVGVGIFFTPAAVAARVPGYGGLGVYLVTAMAMAPVAVVYATLGGRFAEDGGPYVWARAAFGPTLGFVVGWITYVSGLFSTSAILSFLAGTAATSLGLTSPGMGRLVSFVCVWLLAAVAATGLRPSAIVWNVVTLLKLLPLLVLAGLFVVRASDIAAVAEAGRPGLVQLGQAALVVVFATQGFEIVPVPAGNARRGRRAVPAATIGSLTLVVLLYLCLHAACVRALPDLAQSSRPLVEAARVYGGEGASALVAIGTQVSALGIAFGMFTMTPRYLSVLGRADAFGRWLGEIDAKRRVPLRALLVTAVCVTALACSSGLTDLVVFSSIAVLTQFGVSAAALAVLAFRRARGLRRWQLWPTPLALVALALIGQTAQTEQLVVTGGVLGVGLALLAGRRVWRPGRGP